MRRHVENPAENQEQGTLSILLFLLMWILALLALSSAARAEEKSAQVSPATPAQQPEKIEQQTQTASLAKPEPAPPKPQRQLTKAVNAPAKESREITLTRFILISIPDRQLALVDDGQIAKIYPIAVGADGTPSPEGDFTIISRVTDPSWTHKGKVVGPGKNNPVGSRWMGLSLKGYGIHGTNAPRSIGKAASHGCFRMGRKDVEELFKLVRVGDTVAVRAERDELVAQVFGDGTGGDVQVAAAVTTSGDGGQE